MLAEYYTTATTNTIVTIIVGVVVFSIPALYGLRLLWFRLKDSGQTADIATSSSVTVPDWDWKLDPQYAEERRQKYDADENVRLLTNWHSTC